MKSLGLKKVFGLLQILYKAEFVLCTPAKPKKNLESFEETSICRTFGLLKTLAVLYFPDQL